MRKIQSAGLVAMSAMLLIAAACSSSKSSGGPTPTPTPTPISGTITALTGTGAYLVDNSTDTSSSTFSISVTANGANSSDTGTWNCYGPIATSGPGNSYDLFFTTGTAIPYFDINIPAAQWTSAGAITIGLSTSGATGSLTIGTDMVNITGGTVVMDNAPTAENSSASICNFHMGTSITFDNTTAAFQAHPLGVKPRR